LLVAVVVGGIAVTGFFLHGVPAGILLLATAAILGALSWVLRDRVRPEGRPFRIAIVLLLVAVAVIKFVQG
jgi:drug/metabolite transporter (DMT)-like permease